jgi:hypothetical protein
MIVLGIESYIMEVYLFEFEFDFIGCYLPNEYPNCRSMNNKEQECDIIVI